MVCAALSVFVKVVLLPVLINQCHFNTARPQLCAFLKLFLVSLPWLEAPPVSFPTAQWEQIPRLRAAPMQQLPLACQWTNYTVIGVSCSNLRLNKYTDRERVSRSVLLSSTWASSLYAFHRTVQLVCSGIMSHEISVISFIELQWLSHSTFKTQTSPLCAHFG